MCNIIETFGNIAVLQHDDPEVSYEYRLCPLPGA